MLSDIPQQHIHLVIMAGGIGSRFWPLSTPEHPKQFHDILGTGRTLFQATTDRFRNLVPVRNMYVVTSSEYSGLVREQESEIPEENILGEPMRRNTATCIAYAAHVIVEKDPDAWMIVSPADHFVKNSSNFEQIIGQALSWLKNQEDTLMTLGITPDRPETGYGYIQTDGFNGKDIVPVREFREKPDAETAIRYVTSGDYLWNSGIFLWKASSIISAFQRHMPELHALFSGEDVNCSEADELRRLYEKAPNISIDYGILEKAKNIYVARADCGWSDLGTWGSLWQQESKDDSGNSLTPAQTNLYDTRECLIRVPADKQVIIEGLEDYIIVDDNKHLLIFRKQNEQLIGTYSKEISQSQS